MQGYDNKFLFDKDGISSLKELDSELTSALNNSFILSKDLYTYMHGSELWVGNLKNEFMAFYHLVVQYHGWVAGQPAPSLGALSSREVDINCSEEMAKAWDALNKNIYDFESSSEQYKKLRDLE